MGEWADGILDGDFDEETGEYIGPGDGYPRSLAREAREKSQFRKPLKNKFNKPLLTKLDSPEILQELFVIQGLLIGEGYIMTEIIRHEYDYSIRLSTGGMVVLYHNKKIIIQGKPDEKLNKIFG